MASKPGAANCVKTSGFTEARQKEILTAITNMKERRRADTTLSAKERKGTALLVWANQNLVNNFIPEQITRLNDQMKAYADEIRQARATSMGGAPVADTGQDSAAVPPIAAATGALVSTPGIGAPSTAASRRTAEININLRDSVQAVVNLEDDGVTQAGLDGMYDFMRGVVSEKALREDREILESFAAVSDRINVPLDEMVDTYIGYAKDAKAIYDANRVKNLSAPLINAALQGGEAETIDVLRNLSKKIEQTPRHLNESWTNTILPAIEEALKVKGWTAPAWVEELRALVGATRGGDKKANAARINALRELAAKYGVKAIGIEDIRADRARQVTDALNDTPVGSANESVQDAFRRLVALRVRIAEITGEKSAARQIASVGGEKTDAGKLISVLSKLSSAGSEKGRDVTNIVRSAETLMRAGKFDEAAKTIKEAAEIAATSGRAAPVETATKSAETESRAGPETEDSYESDLLESLDSKAPLRVRVLQSILTTLLRNRDEGKKLSRDQLIVYVRGELRRNGLTLNVEQFADVVTNALDAAEARRQANNQILEQARDEGAYVPTKILAQTRAVEMVARMQHAGGKLTLTTKPKAVSAQEQARAYYARLLEIPLETVTAVDTAENSDFEGMMRAGGMTAGQKLVWGAIKDKLANTRVVFVKDSMFDSMLDTEDQYAGLFYPRDISLVREVGGRTGVVVLPERFLYNQRAKYNGVANFTESFLHELVHALTYASVATNTPLRAKLQKMIGIIQDNAKEMYKADAQAFTKAEINALTTAFANPDELVVMAFTNKDVQSGLAKIPLTEKNRRSLGLIGKIANAMQAFVAWVREVTRVPVGTMSALEGIITLTDTALADVEAQRAALVANPDLQLVDTGAKALGMPSMLTKAFPEGARRAAVNSGGKLRRLGHAFSTLRQIMFNSEGLFARTAAMDLIDPNDKRSPVAVVVQTYLQRAQMAVDLLNDIVMGPLRSLRALPKASREKVSEFLLEGTLYEVHADEPIAKGGKNEHILDKPEAAREASVAAHKRLSAQFATFTPAEKAAYKSVVASMEKAHARVIKSIVGSVVTRWYTNLIEKHLRDPQATSLPTAEIQAAGGPVKFVDGLIDRAYKKTLTQAENQMLGDEVFALIESAHKRSIMKGPYVPLQRFGDWVVRWNENEPDTKVFDSKADRDAYTASSSLQVRSEREIYLDKNGQEITQADPAIEQAEIGKAKSALPNTATQAEIDKAVAKAKRAALKATIKQNTATTKYEITQVTKGVAFFESEAEAQEAVEELRKNGKRDVTEYDLRKNPKERASLLEDADFNKMKEAIERDDTLTASAKEKAIQALEQAMLMVVPNRALNASLVRRRKIIGADKNVTRAIANYGIAMANYASAIDTAIPITLGLKAMNDYTAEQSAIQPGAEATKTTARRREYIREIEERVLYSPLDTGGTGLAGPVIRKLQALTYVYFLASPSYVMIQMSQPWLLTLPILSARHGVASATAALTKANADIGLRDLAKGGARDTADALKTLLTGRESDQKSALLDYVKSNLAKQSDGKRLLDMVESLSKEGLLDGDAGMEIIRAEVSEDGPVGRFIGRTEVLTRALPAMVEVVNRSSSAVAAYRLEFARSNDHDAAIRYAYKTVDQSQGDYAAANTARFMDPRRYPLLSPMMTFRKYAQAVYALLVRQVLLSVKGKDAETRREARRTLTMVLMAHATVAGALGLPTEGISIVLGMLGFAFGSKEPWDWELMLRQEAAKLFGKEAAEVIMRGVPRYFGVDLSGRLGLNSLLFMHDLRDFEKKTTNEYLGQLLVGAPGGMVLNAVDSYQQLMKAMGSDKATDYTKAVEGILPKGFRDPLRAWRVAEDGVTTRRGERIDEGRQATPFETAIQAAGFTPAAQAEVYERRNAVQGKNREMASERTDLMRKWRQATPEGRQRIWDSIVKWNQELAPGERGFRITRENLIQSMQEARRRERASGQGDYLPRGREGLRERGDFANTRTER